jgi:hypothetical protein
MLLLCLSELGNVPWVIPDIFFVFVPREGPESSLLKKRSSNELFNLQLISCSITLLGREPQNL